MVEQYLEHSKDILSSDDLIDSRFEFNERRGLGRIYLFGYQNRYDLRKGFPLLTTKKIGFKTVAHELIWFLKGDTNIKYLVDNKVHIWDDDAFRFNLEGMVKEDIFPEVFERFSQEWYETKKEYVQRIREGEEFAERWGELGPVYGSQWIHWPSFSFIEKDEKDREIYMRDPNGINQIERILEGMRKNITSSRHLITAWNPSEVPDMALPPCHTFFHLDSDGERVDLLLYQRSCDMFLGVPFNIASYSMLTIILAQQLGLTPGKFIHTFGDVHFYTGAGERAKWYEDNFEHFKWGVRETRNSGNYKEYLNWLVGVLPEEPKGTKGMDHVTGILEQFTRKPRKLPKISITNKHYNELTIDDFSLKGYNPHPTIKRALSVG